MHVEADHLLGRLHEAHARDSGSEGPEPALGGREGGREERREGMEGRITVERGNNERDALCAGG
jgi:hypothetical protein